MLSNCARTTCKAQYSVSENNDQSCRYHRGNAVFHEGMKSWSCCPDKKAYEFEEFLKIPGCCTGPHIDKLPTPAADVASAKAGSEASPESDQMSKAVENLLLNAVATNPKKVEEEVVVPETIVLKEEDLNDPEDAVIPEGSVCKRLGCGFTSKKDNDINQPCVFHPGAPLFHEGSKGYTCCPRKVLEFEEFLKIKGCKSVPRHRFLEAKKVISQSDTEAAETNGPTRTTDVKFRWDWYQTMDSVIISIFIKQVDKENVSTTFEIGSFSIRSAPSDLNWKASPLFGPITPDECKVNVFKSKIEVILKKADGISWPSLEKTSKAPANWTTFGVMQDGSKVGGSVGGKEMYLAKDIPVSALTKGK